MCENQFDYVVYEEDVPEVTSSTGINGPYETMWVYITRISTSIIC